MIILFCVGAFLSLLVLAGLVVLLAPRRSAACQVPKENLPSLQPLVSSQASSQREIEIEKEAATAAEIYRQREGEIWKAEVAARASAVLAGDQQPKAPRSRKPKAVE